jgi:hypothetical protein
MRYGNYRPIADGPGSASATDPLEDGRAGTGPSEVAA